jgi:hypothetical protein
MFWYLNRTNKQTGLLEEKSNGLYGPFESNREITNHYAKEILEWDEDKINWTDDYFFQVYKHGYYEFLIKHDHIAIFENEPTKEEIALLETKWSNLKAKKFGE